MPAPKFNVIPLHQEQTREDVGFRVNINAAGVLVFKNEDVRIYDLENKYITLMIDREKKSIAWRFFKGGSPESMKELRHLKTNTSGVMVITLGKALKKLDIPQGTPFRNLPVKTYKGGYLEDDVQYITLDPEYIVENKERKKRSHIA